MNKAKELREMCITKHKQEYNNLINFIETQARNGGEYIYFPIQALKGTFIDMLTEEGFNIYYPADNDTHVIISWVTINYYIMNKILLDINE